MIKPAERAPAVCKAAIARSAGSIVVGGLDPGACAPGFMLTRAPRAWRVGDRRASNESFVVFDSILLEELNELVPKRNLPMMLLLSRNVLAYALNMRLADSECTVTALP